MRLTLLTLYFFASFYVVAYGQKISPSAAAEKPVWKPPVALKAPPQGTLALQPASLECSDVDKVSDGLEATVEFVLAAGPLKFDGYAFNVGYAQDGFVLIPHAKGVARLRMKELAGKKVILYLRVEDAPNVWQHEPKETR